MWCPVVLEEHLTTTTTTTTTTTCLVVLEEHVTEDLGRHDEDLALCVEARVARHQPDALAAEALLEILVLLVGERLERRSVHDAAAARQSEVDGQLRGRVDGPRCGRAAIYRGLRSIRAEAELSRAAIYLRSRRVYLSRGGWQVRWWRVRQMACEAEGR